MDNRNDYDYAYSYGLLLTDSSFRAPNLSKWQPHNIKYPAGAEAAHLSGCLGLSSYKVTASAYTVLAEVFSADCSISKTFSIDTDESIWLARNWAIQMMLQFELCPSDWEEEKMWESTTAYSLKYRGLEIAQIIKSEPLHAIGKGANKLFEFRATAITNPVRRNWHSIQPCADFYSLEEAKNWIELTLKFSQPFRYEMLID